MNSFRASVRWMSALVMLPPGLASAREIGLIGRLPSKPRMRPHAVVETDIAAKGGTGLGDAGVGAQVNLLVLHSPPEPLDEDVVAPDAVHADGDPCILQHLNEIHAGELRALVAVEDLRPAVALERLFQRFDAESADSAIDSRQARTLRLNQ